MAGLRPARSSGNEKLSLNEYINRSLSALASSESKGKSEAGAIAPSMAEPKKNGGEDPVPEVDTVNIQPDWEAKPCIHVTGLEGMVSEEELLSLLSQHGSVSSIVFEDDRKDSAIVRFEHSPIGSDDVVAKVTKVLNDTVYNTITLSVERYRSDSLLFIGNLPPEMDDAQLRSMFEPYGTIERAFVLRNAEGKTKGYGFVEYSLKSQASVAKITLGNIDRDGRALRVEWSDCRKVADMFSAVLFIDRIPKDSPSRMENTLRRIFGRYGKVKDCHLIVGVNQQLRGFGFIDFYHTKYADKAYQALDGYEISGSSLRVSFANPSKTVQSYKSRFDNSVLQGGAGFGVRGLVGGLRGMGFPFLGPRFLGSLHPGLLGMGLNMFGRGPLGLGSFGEGFASQLFGGDAGMLEAAGLASDGTVGAASLQGTDRVSGSLAFDSSVISQQNTSSVSSALRSGNSYSVQQPYETGGTGSYKQSDTYYGYEQPYQTTGAYDSKQGSDSQFQYYQSGQQYLQPHTQYQHQDTYYQQQPSSQLSSSTDATQYSSYGQHYGREDAQHPSGQATDLPQYQQADQHSTQLYGEQDYSTHYSQSQTQLHSVSYNPTSQSTVYDATSGSASYGAPPQVPDPSQSYPYTAYQEAATSQVAAASLQSATAGNSQQSLEAQWAAYYASQAANQQAQSNTADVGQKRTADQMNSSSQSTYEYQQQQPPAFDYNYAQQTSQPYNDQQQPPYLPTFTYLHESSAASGYQQQPTSGINVPLQYSSSALTYEQPRPGYSAYQDYSYSATEGISDVHGAQAPAATYSAGYQLPISVSASASSLSSYQQPLQSYDSYYDYNKRPRF